MLETGTKAPDFALPDQNGEIHKLSDYAGKKVILYFYLQDVQSRHVVSQNDIHNSQKRMQLY